MAFEIKQLDQIKDIDERIAYCDKYLRLIGEGSSRKVYLLDEITVLKLAKNRKGIAQNQVEIDLFEMSGLNDLLAEVHAYSDDNTWVVMELAIPLKEEEFEEKVKCFINLSNPKNVEKIQGGELNFMFDEKQIENCMCHIFINKHTDLKYGDLNELDSWGKVKRNGKIKYVLIDYGFNSYVWRGYYK